MMPSDRIKLIAVMETMATQFKTCSDLAAKIAKMARDGESDDALFPKMVDLGAHIDGLTVTFEAVIE